ncbi:MAG: MFS transporter [Nocardioidaceae bacterium]
MLDAYRRILTLPGAAAFSATGLVARLPISMTGLGIVLLVAGRTGSYAYAGSISAAEVVAGAIASPVQGRLADRFGQSRVLPAAALAFGLGIVATVVAIELGWPTPLPHLCAAASGATLPQVGSTIRARWRHAVPERALLQTAFALEAVVDELIFIVGPVLVTFLATHVGSAAGLAAAAVLGVTGGLALAAQRTTQPPVEPGHRRAGTRQPITGSALAPLVVVGIGMGSLFGSAEVVTVAFAQQAGNAADAGWMLASWAAGSMCAGAVLGALTLRSPALNRLRWGATALTAMMAALPFLPTTGSIAAVLFVAGLAISPTLIASISLVEQCVPAARLTEGIAWATSGLATGIAPGSAISGVVIDHYGASVAYLVPVASGLLAVTVAWLMRRR